MIALSSSTDSLQVVLGSTVSTSQLSIYSSWRDISSVEYVPGRTLVSTNNLADVNIVAGPSAGFQRVVDYISVYNTDTANSTVTLKFDSSGTDYTLFKCTLLPNESLTYTSMQGFSVMSTIAAVKKTTVMTVDASTTMISSASLSADITNANGVTNTMHSLTGLQFSVTAGNTYWFKFTVNYTAAATTTGSRWGITGPAASIISYVSRYTLSATSETVTYNAAYDSPAAANASSIVANNLAVIEGFASITANGTIVGRFASEITASAIVAKAGSIVQWQQVL
jgi:hypothetical protein